MKGNALGAGALGLPPAGCLSPRFVPVASSKLPCHFLSGTFPQRPHTCLYLARVDLAELPGPSLSTLHCTGPNLPLMSARSNRNPDHLASQIYYAAQDLFEIFRTGHALVPSVETELKRAVAELLEQSNAQIEHICNLEPAHALHEQQALL